MMSNVEARLVALERSARRWRSVALMGLLLCGSGLALGAKSGRLSGVLSGTVRLQRLELLGPDGRTVILTLAPNERGDGLIEVRNNRGTVVSVLSANERGDGLLELRSHAGDRAASAGSNDRGDGLVQVYNNREVNVAYLGVSYRGDGLIDVGDKTGEWKTSIGVDETGRGLVEFPGQSQPDVATESDETAAREGTDAATEGHYIEPK